MKAIIMAGGEGSRLRPLTCDLPKPMVPLMNKPIMEHIIHLLKAHGILDIGVTLMYLPQKIRDYFGNGSSQGVRLHYFTEDSPLGTAGSVKNAGGFLDETFVVISGDSLTNTNLTECIEFHRNKKSKATLILTRVDVPLEYGVVITDKNGSIKGFLEKPNWGEVFSDTVNTGIYVLEPEVLEYFDKGQKFDFSQDLFPLLLADKQPIYGHVVSDYWCDIGDLKAYLQAHLDVLDGKIRLETDISEIRPGIWAGSGTFIERDVKINAPCFIGSNCHIGREALIDSYSILGDNNMIESRASIKRSVLWSNNFIESGTEIRGAIICNKSIFKRQSAIFENAVVGDHCVINEGAIIKPNTKIWPQKTVDPMAVVDRNIIWGSRHARTIFGENGLSGIINVDISPEFATRLGAAYGSIFKKGSRVVVSSTNSNSARMFKHAFISGILSVGMEVFNLSSLLTPMSRHAIRFLSVEGGIHIKTCDNNLNKICVDFMDSKGTSISHLAERKIENAFLREDFKRCSGEEISKLNNITDYKNYYMRWAMNEADTTRIREKSPKICLASSSEFVVSTATQMLADTGCKVVSFSPASLDSVDSIVEEISKSNADFSALIDSNGETLVLIDSSGRVVKDDLFLALTSLITFKSFPGTSVVVPITAPTIIEELAFRHQGKVIRTKTSAQAVMEQMLTQNMLKSREHMHQFLLNFDALAGLLKILEYICSNDTSLSQLIGEIPGFYMSKKKIFCPWELKGKVMRTLITDTDTDKIELLDGVKFFLSNGWVLVLPDAELPLCRVYSEGLSPEEAELISEHYLEKIKTIINEKDESFT